MPRLAPRIGVSLLVTLLFGPLSSSAHDSDDKRHDSDDKSFEGKWSVVVDGHITWTGEDHRDCVDRATATSGQCVRTPPEQDASNEKYCPEVTPGSLVPPGRPAWSHCKERMVYPHKDDSDRTRTEHDSDR
jgi:hypothetical protein